MAGLDQIKDRIKETLQAKWSEFQESSTYVQLKEKFEALSPQVQKLTVAGAVGLFLLLLALIPYGYLDSASTSVSEFEEKKGMIRELLRLKRDLAQVPDIPTAPASGQLKSQVDGILTELHLLPEQIKEVAESTFSPEPGSKMVSNHLQQSGVRVSLDKLTLKQIVDIGYRLQKISDAVKLTALEIKATAADPHYYETQFRLVGFTVPAGPAKPEPGAKAPPPKKGGP